jgi:hypothetical protein
MELSRERRFRDAVQVSSDDYTLLPLLVSRVSVSKGRKRFRRRGVIQSLSTCARTPAIADAPHTTDNATHSSEVRAAQQTTPTCARSVPLRSRPPPSSLAARVPSARPYPPPPARLRAPQAPHRPWPRPHSTSPRARTRTRPPLLAPRGPRSPHTYAPTGPSPHPPQPPSPSLAPASAASPAPPLAARFSPAWPTAPLYKLWAIRLSCATTARRHDAMRWAPHGWSLS